MRILVVTHRFPYPPDKGDRIRGFSWLEALGSEYQVDLLSFADNTVTESQIDELRCRTNIENIFTIKQNKIFKSIYGVKSFVDGRSLTEGYFYSLAFENRLKTLLATDNYDVCLAICSSAGSYFLKVSPQCKTIVDLVDVDSHKWSLYADRSTGVKRRFYLREAEKVAFLERQLIAISDEVVVITPVEAQRLEFADAYVKVVANPVEIRRDIFPRATDISRIVFVGQMDYFPNVDAVCWFTENVWPMIHELYPHLEFMIVGRNPSIKVRKLSKLNSVTVTGRVDDVSKYLEFSISVIPLRIVCGLQNKLIESLANGRPVVATSDVALSAGFDDGEGLLIADSVDEWINAITRLLEDQSLSYHIANDGQKLITQRFSKEKIYSRMREVVLPETNEMNDIYRMSMVC